MKKKEYINPTMKLVEFKTMRLLAVSGVNTDEIDYGGIDNDGLIIPMAPEMELSSD